jgi:hypothetical protein
VLSHHLFCFSFSLSLAGGSHLKSFLSGGVGGVMAVLVGHPFDLGEYCFDIDVI